MGLKKSWKYGWVWDDETTTPHATWTSTRTGDVPHTTWYTTGDPIEIKAPEWKPDRIVINSPTWGYKSAILQGWECPKCGRVNSPTMGTCPCYLDR